MYAIYGPILREEFATFVRVWNRHKIRTQNNRSHVIPGVPNELYINPGQGKDWKVPFKCNEHDPVGKAVDEMLEPLEEIDIDSFMTIDTEVWCVNQLSDMGFDYQNEEEAQSSTPFIDAYLELRQRVKRHMRSGNAPELALSEVPKGGVEDYVS